MIRRQIEDVRGTHDGPQGKHPEAPPPPHRDVMFLHSFPSSLLSHVSLFYILVCPMSIVLCLHLIQHDTVPWTKPVLKSDSCKFFGGFQQMAQFHILAAGPL